MKQRFHNKKIEDYIIPYSIVMTIIICAVLLFLGLKSLSMSYLIGALTNIICFKLTIKTVDNVINNRVLSAKRAYAMNNVGKLGIYLAVLVIAGFSQKYHIDKEVHLEIIPVAIAFFQVKFIIYFKYLIFDKIFKVKNIDDSIEGPIFPIEEGDRKDD